MTALTDLSARDRMLDAAEVLFGDHGIRATSIRDITHAAHVNVAAVNYHFGSKEKLVAAVLARRAGPVNRARLALLERFEREAGGGPVTVERVLEAFMDPTVELFDQNPAFLKVAARLWYEPGSELRAVLAQQFADTARRFLGQLQRALPELEEGQLWTRFSFAIGAMFHTWTTHREAARWFHVTSADLSARAVMKEWIQFTAAGLRGGSTSPPGGNQ